ncbi:MAG: hypothetical protein ACO2OU_04170 [Thermus aquaticus]|uniref:hypothetical protein n=1 Tax=Thermus aquaticus TaxID=271 RepID=UPI003C08583D
MPVYVINAAGARTTLTLTEAADILRYRVDMAPSRAPDSQTWVGVGEGLAMPVEVSVSVDRTDLPTGAKTVADVLASAVWIGIDDGSRPILERQVLALKRVSISDAGHRWGRMRATLVLGPAVYSASELWDGADTLWDGADVFYAIEEV